VSGFFVTGNDDGHTGRVLARDARSFTLPVTAQRTYWILFE
jgi:hypothetical protein